MKVDNDETYKFGLDVLTEQAPLPLMSIVNSLTESEDSDAHALQHALGEVQLLSLYGNLWKAHGESLLEGDYEPTREDMRLLSNLEIFIDDTYRPQLRASAGSAASRPEYSKADSMLGAMSKGIQATRKRSLLSALSKDNAQEAMRANAVAWGGITDATIKDATLKSIQSGWQNASFERIKALSASNNNPTALNGALSEFQKGSASWAAFATHESDITNGTLCDKIKANPALFSNLHQFTKPIQIRLEHAASQYSKVGTEDGQKASAYCAETAKSLQEVNETLARVFNHSRPSEAGQSAGYSDDLSALTEGFKPLSVDEK